MNADRLDHRSLGTEVVDAPSLGVSMSLTGDSDDDEVMVL
jgi:hypothetical protein